MRHGILRVAIRNLYTMPSSESCSSQTRARIQSSCSRSCSFSARRASSLDWALVRPPTLSPVLIPPFVGFGGGPGLVEFLSLSDIVVVITGKSPRCEHYGIGQRVVIDFFQVADLL